MKAETKEEKKEIVVLEEGIDLGSIDLWLPCCWGAYGPVRLWY